MPIIFYPAISPALVPDTPPTNEPTGPTVLPTAVPIAPPTRLVPPTNRRAGFRMAGPENNYLLMLKSPALCKFGRTFLHFVQIA